MLGLPSFFQSAWIFRLDLSWEDKACSFRSNPGWGFGFASPQPCPIPCSTPLNWQGASEIHAASSRNGGFPWDLRGIWGIQHFYPFLSISIHFYPFVLWTRFVPKLRKLEIHKVWLQAIEFGASHDSLQAVVSRLVQAFGAGLGMAPLTAEWTYVTYLFGYWNTWKHEHTTSGLLEHRRGGSSPDAPQLLPSFFRKELSTGLGGNIEMWGVGILENLFHIRKRIGTVSFHIYIYIHM